MNYTGCRPLSDGEIEQILMGCQGRYASRDRLLILFGVHTGYRISEILSLRVSDVWDGEQVRPIVRIAAGFMKGKSQSRAMPLHARAKNAIQTWLWETGKTIPACGTLPLFSCQQTSRPLSRRQAADILVGAAEAAGIDASRVATHTLRKSFARRMWESPLVERDPAKMARLLGHANWSNTLRYLEFADELDAAVLA